MNVYAVWPYFVLMLSVLGALALPVFRAADEPSQPDRHTATLDGLRGFLALSVFVHHLMVNHRYIESGEWTFPPSGFHTLLGQASVGIFFMITGFLFWGKLLDTKGYPDWKRLYIGRIWRIGPMYLLVVGLMFSTVFWRTGFVLRETPWSVLGAMLQWLALGIVPTQPDINGYGGTRLILVAVTWTIFAEWLFYGSLRLMAPLARKERTPRFVGGVLLLCVPALTVATLPSAGSPTHPTLVLVVGALAWVLTSFLMGMLSAWLLRHDGASRARGYLPEQAASLLALSCLIAVFLGFQHMVGPVQVLLLWVFFHLVCSGSTLYGLLATRVARRMSTVSYSIYLLQGLVLTVIFAMQPVRDFAMTGAMQYWMVGTLCALLLVAASVASYRLVEKPGIARGRRARSDSRKRPTPRPVISSPAPIETFSTRKSTMSNSSGNKNAFFQSKLETPFSFGAVVVTYFPTDEQVANLHSLAGLCARLCVVDNTPQAGDWRRPLVDAGVAVLHNGNRGGIAGAFNCGIVELEALGAELFFLLDQDSKLPPCYFDTMCQAAMAARGREGESEEGAAFLIGPLVHDTNLDALIPQFGLQGKRVYQFDLRQPFTEPLIRCAFLISSGSLISRAAWVKVGRFDERYVIDHVDTDYCMRALRRDVPLYLNPHVVLQHQIGDLQARSLFGWKIYFINYPAARRYYIARNALDLSRAYVRTFPAILFINVYTLKQILPMLMFEHDRLRKSIALMVGFFDGLFGRLGGLRETHPRVGKYLIGND